MFCLINNLTLLAANNEELRSGEMSAADVECGVRDGYPHIYISRIRVDIWCRYLV